MKWDEWLSQLNNNKKELEKVASRKFLAQAKFWAHTAEKPRLHEWIEQICILCPALAILLSTNWTSFNSFSQLWLRNCTLLYPNLKQEAKC